MSTIDYKLLKGEDLFTYFTQDHPDKELSSLVEMLPLAIFQDNTFTNSKTFTSL